MNHTMAGCCEFFATAATLLLRQAKILARYVTGNIAHEYSKIESQLIVRQRDAHAWVKIRENKKIKDTLQTLFQLHHKKRFSRSGLNK